MSNFATNLLLILFVFIGNSAYLLAQIDSSTVEMVAADKVAYAAERTENGLKITYDGRPVADYTFSDANIPRPYFSSLRAPDGTQVTRNFPPVEGKDPMDHGYLHPGLWMAFGDLNGVDFWRNQGRIEHVRFSEEPVVENGILTFSVEEKYLDRNGTEVCRGINHFRFSHTPESHMLVWDATLSRADGPLAFGPQHELGMGFRMATPLCVEGGNGKIVSSHGGKDEAGNWGRLGEWWDYSGEMNGRRIGMLVVPSPENSRPVWSHSRDYGFLAINPTGPPPNAKDDVPSVPFTVPAGEKFRMRAAFLMHSTPATEEWDPAAAAMVVREIIR